MNDYTEIKNDNQLIREMNNWNVKDELKGFPVEKILEHQACCGFSVALLNVDGGLNVGSIIRSANIFGAWEVFLIGKKRYDKRSTVGAHNYIDIIHIDEDCLTEESALRAISAIKEHGTNPIAIEQGGIYIDDTIGIHTPLRYLAAPCFIFGSENEGIPECLSSKIPKYSIEQHGVMRSLNVAAAAAIVMYEFTRRETI